MRAAVLTLVLLAACSADQPAAPSVDNPLGRYTLRTVNGGKPPAVLNITTTHKLEILDGVVNLHATGTYTDSTWLRITDQTGARLVTDVSQGSWMRAQDRVDFSSVRGEDYSMTVTETSLHQDLVGSRLIYRK